MICAFFATDSGTVCVIGLDADDTTRMMARKSEPGTIDFNNAVEVGIAIPSFLQIIYVKDREEFDERIKQWLAIFGIDSTDKMIPIEKMPRPFEGEI